MRIRILIIVFALLPLCLLAQRRSRDTYTPAPDEQTGQTEQASYDNSDYNYNDNSNNSNNGNSCNNNNKANKEHKKIVTGFSGGMMIHGGYLFSKSPDELFRNGSLTGEIATTLPRDGFTMGLGGTLRMHLVEHIHLGGEGHMSFMPLAASGTSIRTGWGGAMCDFYASLGNVRPLIGLVVGGGSTRRLYVPDEDSAPVTDDDKMEYNASFTKTPFFLLDPYAGLEIAFEKLALLIRVDYMLPFGKGNKGLADTEVNWSNFLSPSGPRLYIGCLFGH